MRRTRHLRWSPARLFVPFAAALTLYSPASFADRAIDAAATETHEAPAPVDESAPIWMWFIPPVGLILGLTLGARLRSSRDRARPKA